MKLITKIIGAACLCLGLSYSAYSQSACHGYGKSACKPDFEGFTLNPQILNTELASGETAEVSMVFSKNHDYIVNICSEEHMGEIGFKIKSSTGEVLFDNQEYEMVDTYQFAMNSTKRLIIEVTFMGASSEDGFEETGCAAILVGYHHSTQSGFR